MRTSATHSGVGPRENHATVTVHNDATVAVVANEQLQEVAVHGVHGDCLADAVGKIGDFCCSAQHFPPRRGGRAVRGEVGAVLRSCVVAALSTAAKTEHGKSSRTRPSLTDFAQ